MTRDDITRMAREAHLLDDGGVWFSSALDSDVLNDDLERFAALVAEAEREACARMFDMPDYLNGEQEDWFREVAATIRARGEE